MAHICLEGEFELDSIQPRLGLGLDILLFVDVAHSGIGVFVRYGTINAMPPGTEVAIEEPNNSVRLA
jgi:hypothetical protein